MTIGTAVTGSAENDVFILCDYGCGPALVCKVVLDEYGNRVVECTRRGDGAIARVALNNPDLNVGKKWRYRSYVIDVKTDGSVSVRVNEGGTVEGSFLGVTEQSACDYARKIAARYLPHDVELVVTYEVVPNEVVPKNSS